MEVPAGRGRVVRELLQHLARRNDSHRYLLYARERWERPLGERLSWRLLASPDPWWHMRTAFAAARECDVFLSTNSYLTVWFLRVPAAVIVYDMVVFERRGEARRSAALIERATIGPALRRVERAICISRATERDLVRRFPQARAKSSVVHLAAGAGFAAEANATELDAVRRRYGLDKPFVLCVGTLEPRKNLLRVLAAFATLPEGLRARHRLVVVGPRGWEFAHILHAASARSDEVKLLGHVPDSDLAALYRLCEVFCYPSLYEGFGLPLLEAMQCGAPSIASNVSSLPEVGGDGAVYVDPTSVEEIGNALAGLLQSEQERARLRERGLRQAARFSWQRTADEIAAQLEAIARSRPSTRS